MGYGAGVRLLSVFAQVVGAGLLVWGAWLLSPVAAVLLAGVLLLAAGTLAERQQVGAPDVPAGWVPPSAALIPPKTEA